MKRLVDLSHISGALTLKQIKLKWLCIKYFLAKKMDIII
jgi:hypothetical protein